LEELNLAYHDVGVRRPGDRYTLDARTFARHAEAVAGTRAHLTFDDGMRSAAEIVAPIVDRHGLRCTFFVITEAINAPPCLDEGQIRELHAAGHVIGSHTHTHPRRPFLKDLPDERVREEWRTSKAILEDILQVPVDSCSMPYGYYTPRLARLAGAEGYRHLFVSAPRTWPIDVDGLLVHGRFGVTAATSVERVHALARGRRRAVASEQAMWAARRGTKLVLGPSWFKIRGAILERRHA
jgi:peptidoglycan/xylan/chitin deacetylase (PgdA/CDA1 family)